MRMLDELKAYAASVGKLGLEEVGAYLRHLRQYIDFQRALLDYRYVTALLLAVRIDLFEHLDARRPMARGALAQATDTDPAALETLLASLETRGVVERRSGGWVLSPFAADFLAPDAPATDAPFLELLADYADSFAELERALTDAEPPDRFDIRHDQPTADHFLAAVNRYMDRTGRELLARAGLDDVEHLICGSMGVSFSAHVLTRCEAARVTYGCLEHLTERIPRLRNTYEVDSSRVVDTHVHAGEPGDDQWGWEAFDLVFLTKKMILDPANDIGEKFARKAYEVLEPGGAAVFWEAFHDRNGDTPKGVGLESLVDLGVSPQAGPLYRDSFRRRLRRIGFDEIEFVDCLGGATSFAVARRKR
jgi:hypothetical protein